MRPPPRDPGTVPSLSCAIGGASTFFPVARSAAARIIALAVLAAGALAAVPGAARARTASAGPLELHVSCKLPDPAKNVARGTFHGRAAIRFHLALADRGACPADIRRGGHNRAELRSDALPRDRALRIVFSVFIPRGFAATGNIAVGQFHQRRAKPLVLLKVSPKGYRATPGSGLKALAPEIARLGPLFGPGGFGRWHEIVMAAKFSETRGYIRISADGRLRFEARGPTVATRPFFKIGLYGQARRMAGPLTVFVTEPVLSFD